MNCLQSRRLLLAVPREQSAEHRNHILACQTCAKLAQRLPDLEREIEDAALVTVPDALRHRILLQRRRSLGWQYAAAAVVALASALAVLFAADVIEAPEFPNMVMAVGPSHPAVVAITEVMDERIELDNEAPNDTEMEKGLKRLGLTLKPGRASAHYIGKCRIEGSTDCERIVLSTPDVYANVMLMPDYPLTGRVMVEDRRMVALVSPAGKGSYVVVAESSKIAKRVAKLFVRG